MSAKKNLRTLKLGFALYALGMCASTLLFHVDYLNFSEPSKRVALDAMPVPYSFGVKTRRSPAGAASYQFRGTEERLGIVNESLKPDHLRTDIILNQLNVGVHGASKSSPAVDETGIYIGADGGWFYGLNLDGSVRWKHYETNSYKGFHATAALDELMVYVGTYSGELIAFDKASGRIQWVTKLGETIGSSATIVGDAVLVSVELTYPADGFLASVDRKTGRVLWRSEKFGEQSHSSPTVDKKHGLVFAGANNDMLFAVHLDSGKIAWKVLTDGKIKSTSALVEDKIYFTTWGGTLHSTDVTTGKDIWRADLEGQSQSSPSYVPDSDILVVSSESGNIYGIDRATGKRMWKHATGTETSRMPSALVVKSEATERSSYYIWMSCSEESICALEAISGRELARYKLPGRLSGMPVMYKQKLYLALNEAGLVRLSRQRLGQDLKRESVDNID